MSIKNLSSANLQKLAKNILSKAYDKINSVAATLEPKVANNTTSTVRVLTRGSNGINSTDSDLTVTMLNSNDKTLWGGGYIENELSKLEENMVDAIGAIGYYGMKLDLNESNPSSVVSYFGINTNYEPAHMDFTNDVFDYGDWGDAWFIKNIKVVLMRFDGTIYCELDKNDYTKDINGNTVNISSSNTIGNVMIGIPTVWIKYDISNPMKPKYYFSATKIDDTWHAYAHTNRKGEIVPYKYLAAYEGWSDGTRMRSVSGVVMPTSGNYTGMYPQQLRYQCMNNYTGNDITDDNNPWDMKAWCDRMLINLLLLLIGKSTDTQEVFGHGNEYGLNNNQNSAKGAPWNSNANGVLNTGTMNDKGLFWGANDTGSTHKDYKGVKVFGIEHLWGNIRKWELGWNHVDTTTYNASDTFIKMTPEKVNGVDYIPLPKNDNVCPDTNWSTYNNSMWQSLESYGYTKYSWFEEQNIGKKSMVGIGVQWKGNQYGISPYRFPNEGRDKYFPDHASVFTSDHSNPFFCMAQCSSDCDFNDFCGAFYLGTMRVDRSSWYFGSFLCSFGA